MRPDRSPLLVVIALLLVANLVATLVPRGAPAPELRLLPAAQAQDPSPGPFQAELRTGKTLVTSSPDGANLYVWYCEIVNGLPTFKGSRYTTGG